MKSWVQELKENGPANLSKSITNAEYAMALPYDLFLYFAVLAVVGNKIDLEDREQVSWEDAMNYAKV
jgi:GTPase SAR1 family protein